MFVHDNGQPEPAYQEFLSRPIRDLGLKLEGSPVERFVEQLYRELDAKGLTKFRPACYLTDEWGCPSGEPVIGIPFYLAHAALAELEKQTHDLEDAREIMMYLRHEAGHAFTYAYRLHNSPEWKQMFGPFRRPYRDNYRPAPFSRDYVRHLPGWYAQKHPDEDFAETFAVWLTPRSNWRKRYRGWPALEKLRYLDRLARKVGRSDPPRRRGQTDITVDEMETTVARVLPSGARAKKLPSPSSRPTPICATSFVFRKEARQARPAQEFLREHRKAVIDKVAQWTGAQRPLIKTLLDDDRRTRRKARSARRPDARIRTPGRTDGVHDRAGDDVCDERKVYSAVKSRCQVSGSGSWGIAGFLRPDT